MEIEVEIRDIHDGLSECSRAQLRDLYATYRELSLDEFIELLSRGCNLDADEIVSSILDKEISRLRAGEDTRYVRNGEVSIFGNNDWSVTLKSVVQNTSAISTYPLVSLIVPLAGEIQVRSYSYSEALTAANVSEGAPELGPMEVRNLSAGSTYIIDGRAAAISLAFDQAVFFRVNCNLGHSVIWHYSSDCAPLYATPIFEGAPGVLALISCCAGINSKISKQILVALCQHHAFDVRWHALQALGRIDGNLALSFRGQFLSDPNPMVRSAAQRSFDAVSGD